MGRPCSLLLLLACATLLCSCVGAQRPFRRSKPGFGGPPVQACNKADKQPNDNIPKATCPAVGDPQALDYGYCMPKIHNDCKEASNWQCETCILLYEAIDSNGVCLHSTTGPNIMCRMVPGSITTIQISQAESNAGHEHWKLVPSHPIRGTEDLHTMGNIAPYDQLWQDGWAAVKARDLPFKNSVPATVNTNTMGFAINSPYTRTAHQMHIHIARVNDDLYKKYPIKHSGPFGPTWITLQQDKAIMMCPATGAKLAPFTALKEAIVNGHWKVADAWLHSTVAVISPEFCKGGANTCEFCVLVFYNVGDETILYYP